MADYLYAVVDCKTPGCGNVIAVHYLGKSKRPQEINRELAGRFAHLCVRCGQYHQCDFSEYRVESYPFAPPKGWEPSSVPSCCQKTIDDANATEQKAPDPGEGLIRIRFG